MPKAEDELLLYLPTKRLPHRVLSVSAAFKLVQRRRLTAEAFELALDRVEEVVDREVDADRADTT